MTAVGSRKVRGVVLAAAAFVTGVIMVPGSPAVGATDQPSGSPVQTANTWCPVPYLTAGSSTTIATSTGNVQVTATVNTAEVVGGQPNFYLHRPDNQGLDTTWTFTPAITEIRFETINHADAQNEKYDFTATNGSGPVETWNITDLDGYTPKNFSSPVSQIATTYTPTSGPFGSFLLLSLPSSSGECRPGATVQAPSGAMDFGAAPPELDAPTARADGTSEELAFDQSATCDVYLDDVAADPIELSASTPPGIYVTRCTGGSIDGHVITGYENGTFTVRAAPSTAPSYVG